MLYEKWQNATPENLTRQYDKEISVLQDKLKRRNLQISDLKARLKEAKERINGKIYLDLLTLCEDNEVMKQVIEEYFNN